MAIKHNPDRGNLVEISQMQQKFDENPIGRAIVCYGVTTEPASEFSRGDRSMPSTSAKIIAAVIAMSGVVGATGALALSPLEHRGRTIAVRLCAQCHAIGKTDKSSRAGAPPFRQLEQRVNLDTFASRLRQGLMSGHYDMPEFRFGREDARALVAYLRSIQSP